MRGFGFKYLLSVLIIFALGTATEAKIQFASESPIAKGRWIKITTGETGIYSISYDQLREIGFDHPEKVAVCGKGGWMPDMNFTDGNGVQLYKDELLPVAVSHKGDRLYFYALGVDRIQWNSQQGYFQRVSKNIYSDCGAYFLTDAIPPKSMDMTSAVEEPEKITTGCGYMFHEKDLAQNHTGTGQLFWGEDLMSAGGELNFKAITPLAQEGTARLEYSFIFEPDKNAKVPYTYKMDIAESEDSYAGEGQASRGTKLHHITPSGKFSVTPCGSYNITLAATASNARYVNLDYWLLTYPKALDRKFKSEEGIELYSIPAVEGKGYSFQLPSGCVVWDVTDVANPKECASREIETGAEEYFVKAEAPNIDLAIIPAKRDAKIISDWRKVENTNLHALQGADIELVIASVPEFIMYAEEIAELHRRNDGIKVAVVTPEQLYNEFSGGVPDPIAYRAFMKMLYDGEGKPVKNLLLLGESENNFRNGNNPALPYSTHIAFQDLEPDYSNDAGAVYDYYGMLGDNIDLKTLYRVRRDAGVGVVSCRSGDECRRYIRKLRRYMDSAKDFAWVLNDMLTVGGTGDVHTYDRQAEEFAESLRESTDGYLAVSNISIDAFGSEPASERFLTKLNEGKICTVYIGHADSKWIGQDMDFFTTSDVRKLRNPFTGVAFLAGCNFSFPDKGIRGIGEDLLLSTDYGLIGGVMSCRAVMASSNYDVLKNFAKAWWQSDRETSPTIGEIYAQTKSNSKFSPSINFFYAGDPALKVPVATKSVKVEIPEYVIPGRKLRIRGAIEDKDNKSDCSFTGKGVLKIMKPEVSMQSLDYVTGTCLASSRDDRDTLIVKYPAERLVAMEFDINDGEFDTELLLPLEFKEYVGKELNVHFSAYNPGTQTGAIGRSSLSLHREEDQGSNEVGRDTILPAVSVVYNRPMNTLHVEVIDETALLLSPEVIELIIDGEKYPVISDGSYPLQSIGRSYAGTCDVIDLPEGEHHVEVTCVDLAGNRGKQELVFSKEKEAATLMLHLSTKAAVDSLEIEVLGSEGDMVELTIVNDKGKRVLRKCMTEDRFAWDCRNERGEMLPPGLYRIKVAVNAEEGIRKYSKWETIAILQ